MICDELALPLITAQHLSSPLPRAISSGRGGTRRRRGILFPPDPSSPPSAAARSLFLALGNLRGGGPGRPRGSTRPAICAALPPIVYDGALTGAARWTRCRSADFGSRGSAAELDSAWNIVYIGVSHSGRKWTKVFLIVSFANTILIKIFTYLECTKV